MYNSLTGTITSLADDACCVDVGGVEYVLTVTWSLRDGLEPGARKRILVYLLHKEDQMRLFGFSSTDERELFKRLMKVSGVGPGLAVRILSGMSLARLAAAIEGGDVALLSSIPGLGKKTAQKVILGLQGTLVAGADAAGPSPWAEIVTALCDMGFERAAATAAVNRAAQRLDEGMDRTAAEGYVLRESIVDLSSSGGG